VLSRVVSGSIGSIVTALAVTPLEVVKVRQQAESPSITLEQQPALPPKVKPCPRGCGTFVFNNGLQEYVLPKSAVPYFDKTGRLTEKARTSCWPTTPASTSPRSRPLGTFAMVRRIFANEGFGGIYAGLSPTLVMSVPSTVLYFTVYDEIVSRLRHRQYHRHDIIHNQSKGHNSHHTIPLSWWIPLVGGATARLLTTLAVAPLELIRTRQASVVGGTLTSTDAVNTGLWSDLKNVVKLEGATSLYKGLGPTLWRDVPFSAIYWLSVERLREFWKFRAQETPSPLFQAGQAFVNGALSGMIAAAATTPFDVAKTRQQMVVQQVEAVETTLHSEAAEFVCHHDGAVAYRTTPSMEVTSNGNTKSPARPMGTFGILQKVYETEGIAGLWRGNQTRMIKIAPACAIMISCYELGKRLLD
jgi:solute carrier family 25 protein 39/40